MSPAGPPRRRLPGEDKVGPSPRRLDPLLTTSTHLSRLPGPPRSPPSLSRPLTSPERRRRHGRAIATATFFPAPRLPEPYSPSASSTPPTPSVWSRGATERPHHRLLPPWPGGLHRRFAPASSPPSPLCSHAGHGEPLPSSPRPCRRRSYLVAAIPAVAEPSAADARRRPPPGDQMATRSSPSPSHAHVEVPWSFTLSAKELPLLSRIEPSSGRCCRRR